MNKFFIVRVVYSDQSEEFEIRMNVGSSSVMIGTRSDIESARRFKEFLDGRIEVNREVVQ